MQNRETSEEFAREQENANKGWEICYGASAKAYLEWMDQMLEQVGLSRNRNVFITNIVKCRPPENRDPLPEECLACRPWLDRILETIDPKIILCVGRIAAQQLFDPHFRVTRQHGELREWNGRLVMATFHPAALLRNPSYKPMMEEDLRKLAALAAEEQNAQIL